MLTIVAYCGGIIFLLLACLFLLYTTYLFYVHHKYSHLPSPKLPSFYLGHIPDIVRLRKERGNPQLAFAHICEYWVQEAGSTTIVVYLFHNALIVVADPDVVKTIVTDFKNDKPKLLNESLFNLYGERFLGNGLFSILDYDTWKPKRKIFDPAFNKSYIKELAPRFNSLVDDFLKKLKPLADGKTVVPLKDHIDGFVLTVVSEILFSSDFTKSRRSSGIVLPPGYSNYFTYIVTKVFEGADKALEFIYPPWIHYFHPFEAKEYQEAMRALRSMGRDCIQKRIKDIEDEVEIPHDLLTHILQSSSLKKMTMEEMLDDFCTLYVAGYDTTLGLLSYAIILIHQHPEVLNRVLEEINEVLGDKTEVSVDDIKKLTYTEQVLNESLRMYPVVDSISKSIHSDLIVGDKVIPAKSETVLMFEVMCRMPEHFDNPDVFNPDRFGPGKKPSSFVYAPFGVGHRSCIGKHFAMMEAKIMIARLLQTFSVTIPDDYELVPVQKMTSHPKGNLPCTLRPVTINN